MVILIIIVLAIALAAGGVIARAVRRRTAEDAHAAWLQEVTKAATGLDDLPRVEVHGSL